MAEMGLERRGGTGRHHLGRLQPQPAVVVFTVLTLFGALWQTASHRLLSPPLDIVDRFGVRLVDLAAGEWWRLLTAAFVSSAGWPHALLNIAGAGLVARPLEREHGTGNAVLVLTTSAAAAFASGVWGHGVHWLSAGGSGLVLGCAGFVTARWRASSRQAKVGAVLVLAATFALPVALAVAGVEPRGSAPAHLGGFVAGVVVGFSSARGHVFRAVAGVAAISLGSGLVLLVPLLPGEPDIVSCNDDAVSWSTRGAETRLLFRSSRRDVAVRWISPRATPGNKFIFTGDRRGRMPWYAYEGALYEVVDASDRCLLRARATRWTSAVDIPR